LIKFEVFLFYYPEADGFLGSSVFFFHLVVVGFSLFDFFGVFYFDFVVERGHHYLLSLLSKLGLLHCLHPLLLDLL
jgi:hypothetical protein